MLAHVLGPLLDKSSKESCPHGFGLSPRGSFSQGKPQREKLGARVPPAPVTVTVSLFCRGTHQSDIISPGITDHSHPPLTHWR